MGLNNTYETPWGELAMAPHHAVVSPTLEWGPPSVKMAHLLKSLPTVRVVVRTLGKQRQWALGARGLKVPNHDATGASSKTHVLKRVGHMLV